MSINPAIITTIQSGRPYFRITAPSFNTTDPSHHRQVVNGKGAFKNRHGARYNNFAQTTVYLTEDVETCLAESVFYFNRKIVESLEELHRNRYHTLPLFEQRFVLWEVIFAAPIPDIFDMSKSGALSSFVIFPSLLYNPSQDYLHLKEKRNDIQSIGYKGLRAPSSRTTNGGYMVVSFEDLSGNVYSITPHPLDLRLITLSGASFINHLSDILDFTAAEARIRSTHCPVGGTPYFNRWQKVISHR
jgi:RES domain-containing protein